MKTLKKLFSVSAIVALLGTLAPMYAFGATYSDELEEAYKYAYAHEVTTMTSIDNADMYGSLTRIALAKMIANYAINVLGMTPDTSAKCTFTDVTAALDAQYDNGVTKACQLGLMGQNITAFRPNDLVTRAEFGTTLSRALNANSDELASMNAANPYYKDHLNFLKSEGIMNQIDNPGMTEVRGYVMLMMMRADEGYTPVEGCTAEELLACITADDYDACIAACSDENNEDNSDPEEVKAGTLKVTMSSEKGGDIPNYVSSLPVVTYTLKATDEDVNVTSLVVKQGGYGDEDTIAGAALFINGARVSKVKNLDLNKEVTLNLTTAYTIKAGKSVDIELRIANEDMDTSQFTIELVDVNSSAEKVSLPSSRISNTFKFVGTDTAELTLSATTELDSPKVGTKGAELFEIKAEQTEGEDQDIQLNSLTLLASNKDLADYLENIELVLDNEVVAEGTMNGKYLTFVFDKAYTLEKNKKAIFTVKADVIGGAGESDDFYFTLETMMDVTATAVAYDAPVNVYTYPVKFDDFSVKAGKVTIDRENPSSTTFTKNRTNVYLGSFTIKNNAGGSLYLQNFALDITGDVDVIDSVKVRYGSTTAGLIELDNNYADDTEMSIGSKLTVYMYADIKNTGVDNKNFKVSLDTIKIEDGDDNALSDTDISMPASWLQMKGTASALNVTKVNLADKSFSKGAEDIDAVSFKVKTNNVDGVKIKRIGFSGSDATLNTNTVRSAKLYVGDTEYDATVQNGTIKVASNINLAANTTTTFTLKVNLASNPTITDGFSYTLTSIDAEDTSADRNDLTSDDYAIAGRKITVAENGNLSITMENTDNNKYDKSILAGTDAIIAEYQLKATYEDVNADAIKLTFSDDISSRVSDIELTYGEQVISNALISGKIATFESVDLDISTTKAPLTVKLITKEINSDNGTGVLAGATLDEIELSELVGNDTGNPITTKTGGASKIFDIVPATITASVVSTSNAQTKVNLSVNKGNNELDDTDLIVTLSGLVLEEVGGNGSLTGDKWTIVNPDNTTGAYQLAEGDNEFTVTYVVNPSANNLSYTVNMTDVAYTTNATSDVLSNRMQKLQLISR